MGVPCWKELNYSSKRRILVYQKNCSWSSTNLRADSLSYMLIQCVSTKTKQDGGAVESGGKTDGEPTTSWEKFQLEKLGGEGSQTTSKKLNFKQMIWCATCREVAGW
uniref:Uncharacterized protein n=1 Tax=Arundo donax TaxID=35708 RepID=A0A0A8Z4U4_ARUDO